MTDVRPALALVVPGLENGGGVPSVANFLIESAKRDGSWSIRLISLCMASDDVESVSIRKPSTWARGVGSRSGEWLGNSFTHIGAQFGELEFQRYRRRDALDKALKGCNVIQVVCGSPAFANTVVGLGIPVALQVATLARVERRMRDSSWVGVAGLWRALMTKITTRYDNRALRTVDAVQVENPWMLDYAVSVNRGRDVDIQYAPPGLDTEFYVPEPNRTSQSNGYILCVGRLADPRKNVSFLLSAYSLLGKELVSRFELVLAGASPPPDDFWQRVRALGLTDRIRFVSRPSSEALLALYQGATVFALPSDEEGLGIVVLEAMACGIPVVCTRCGGPEGILTDGREGFLVDLGDTKRFSERIGQLLRSAALNEEMGKQGRARILEQYASGVAAEAFLGVWRRLLARKRG